MSGHLWEVEHDYYCAPENYYTASSVTASFDSWAGFLTEYAGTDMDLNLVFRWDWLPANPGDERERDVLRVFFMQQRKGKYCNAEIDGISREDEPSVRAWLEPRLAHLLALWAPLSLAEGGAR